MRWNRYDVVRIRVTDDENTYRRRTVEDRVASFPARWMARRSAARRLLRIVDAPGANDDTRFTVRPTPLPGPQPTYWNQLQVLQASRWSPLPHATVTNGGGVVHTSIGLTRWHALGRASRWASARSAKFVTISRWHGQHTYVPDDLDAD